MDILTRLTEPSSALGVGMIFAGIKLLLIGDAVTGVGMICSGIGAILLPETK
jgi:hypothetical protein